MNFFISGGCKNGKSYFAQQLAKENATKLNKPLYYIATLIPRDDEDLLRIKRHLSEREGWGFITIEQGNDPDRIIADSAVDLSGVFLFDSVTALLDNEMFGGTGCMDSDAPSRVVKKLLNFAEHTGNTIFVSDYIYGDYDNYPEKTEEYRAGLAYVDKKLARVCSHVIEFTCGIPVFWK